MKSINETNDKSLIYRYKHTTLKQTEEEKGNPTCPYCQRPKKQVGRFWVCNCSGKSISLLSGKTIKK